MRLIDLAIYIPTCAAMYAIVEGHIRHEAKKRAARGRHPTARTNVRVDRDTPNN